MTILERTILGRLQAKQTGMRRYDEFREPVLSVDCGKTGEVRPYTRDANEEWHLTGTVRVTFWANKAQFSDAIKVAEKALIARLYADVLAELPELRLAISNGDRRSASAVLDRIEATIHEGGC